MKKPDASERRHFGYVADLGCILCDHLGTPGTGAQVHHIREGAGVGRDE